VAFCFDVIPNVFEFAVGADEKRAADDAEKRAAEEFFHAARAVGFNRLQIRIAEEIEVEFLLSFERGLRLDGVAAHPEDDHAQLVELLLCVTKLGRFGRSTGSVGFRIEKEHDSFAEVIGERDVVAGVVFQAKCGGFVTNFQHVFTKPQRDAGLKTGHYKTGKRGRVGS